MYNYIHVNCTSKSHTTILSNREFSLDNMQRTYYIIMMLMQQPSLITLNTIMHVLHAVSLVLPLHRCPEVERHTAQCDVGASPDIHLRVQLNKRGFCDDKKHTLKLA